MFRKALLPSCLFLVSVALPLHAQEFGSTYVGGNVGGGLMDVSSSRLAGDEKPVNLTFGLVGGVTLNRYFALESDVSYLGKGKLETDLSSHTLWAWSNSALAHYPLSDKADIYAKAGISSVRSQWSPSAGGGIYYRLTQDWLLDVGYRWVADVPDADGDLYEFVIGARYQPPIEIPEPSQPLDVEDVPLVEQPNIMALFEQNRSGRYVFDADSAHLKPTPELRALAQSLLQHERGDIHVIGHAEASEVPDAPSLSMQRAQAVADFLIERGVPSERVVVTSVNDSSESPMSRRVDIEFYPEVTLL